MFVKRVKETCYSAISDNMGLKMLKKKNIILSPLSIPVTE